MVKRQTNGIVIKGRENGWFGGVGKKYSDMMTGFEVYARERSRKLERERFAKLIFRRMVADAETTQ